MDANALSVEIKEKVPGAGENATLRYLSVPGQSKKIDEL
jgi:hypothetical protein